MLNHYDVIIIGTGAGGGTLAQKLAPSGKKILLLERGDFVPREKTIGIHVRSMSKQNITPKKSGTTKTATHSIRTKIITWAAIQNFMAWRSSVCAKKILANCDITMEFLPRGRLLIRI